MLTPDLFTLKCFYAVTDRLMSQHEQHLEHAAFLFEQEFVLMEPLESGCTCG